VRKIMFHSWRKETLLGEKQIRCGSLAQLTSTGIEKVGLENQPGKERATASARIDGSAEGDNDQRERSEQRLRPDNLVDRRKSVR
jgi:hypothetical protein